MRSWTKAQLAGEVDRLRKELDDLQPMAELGDLLGLCLERHGRIAVRQGTGPNKTTWHASTNFVFGDGYESESLDRVSAIRYALEKKP